MAVKSLGQLTLDLVTRTGGWMQGLDAAQRRSSQWRRQVERDLKRVGTAAVAAGAAAASGLAVMTRQGLEFVDNQAKTSARLGSTIDDLRALQIAASDYGIEQGSLESSLASFTKRLGDAARGTGEAQQAFEALGLDAAELARMPLADQLALVADRISQVDSAAERTSIADRLMSGGRGMVNLFQAGGEAIRNAVEEVDEFGLSISRVDAARVEAANDAIGRIPRALEPIRNQLAISLAAPILDISERFNDAARASNGFAAEVVESLASTAEFISRLLEGIEDIHIALLRVQRFEFATKALGEQVGLNLSQGYGRMSNYGADNPPPETGSNTQRYNEIDAMIRRMERGDTALSGLVEYGRETAQRIRDDFEARQSGDNDGLNERAAEMVNGIQEATDATGDYAEELESAAAATSDFADTVSGSAATIAQAMAVIDPRYNIQAGGDTASERARSRFEASAFRIGDPSVINFGGSMMDRSAARLNSALLGPAQSGGASGERVPITLHLVGPNGTQSAEGDLTKELADILSSAAGSISGRD